MKTIEQIALSVAYKCFSDYADDRVTTLTFMTGKDEVLKFAEKFLASWLEQHSQEPVAWMGRDGEDFSYKESSYFTQPLFLAPQPTIPEGYVLVPKEPTEAMVLAARQSHEEEAYLPYSVYKSMIEAAQGGKE